jgi:hypothetical protein
MTHFGITGVETRGMFFRCATAGREWARRWGSVPWLRKAGRGGAIHERQCFLQVPPHFNRSCLMNFTGATFVPISHMRYPILTVIVWANSLLHTGYSRVALLYPSPSICATFRVRCLYILTSMCFHAVCCAWNYTFTSSVVCCKLEQTTSVLKVGSQ